VALDFRVDYDFVADWPDGYEFKTGGVQADQITTVTSPVAQGLNAKKFIVHSGDSTGTNQERAEGRWFASNEQDFEGLWRWYSWSTYFESPWQNPSNWGIFTQIKADDAFAQAPFKFDATDGNGNGKLTLQVNTGQEVAPSTWDYDERLTIYPSVPLDLWNDCVLGIFFHRTDGAIRVYHRRRGVDSIYTLAVSVDSVPTLLWRLSNGLPVVADHFLKQGFYRNASGFTSTLYHDNMLRGATVDDVNPTLAAQIAVPAPSPVPMGAPMFFSDPSGRVHRGRIPL
jgi:Polysaccharide lyase